MNLYQFQRFHIHTQLHFKTSLEIYACDFNYNIFWTTV